jgi:hypothetical protein
LHNLNFCHSREGGNLAVQGSRLQLVPRLRGDDGGYATSLMHV